MTDRPDQPTTSTGATDGHIHRWRIGDQAGATSSGVCACGAEKEFPNAWDRETGTRSWAGTARGGR